MSIKLLLSNVVVIYFKLIKYIYFMKKMSFITLKGKYILLAIVCLAFVVLLCIAPAAINSMTPKGKYTVVLDAGHGGIDGGSVGKTTSVTEASLNLDYAKCLQNKLVSFGFNVVMTRSTESGLYNPLASNKKRDDMKKRKAIIENANADFVISIHMNSYRPDSCGAQVFYGKNDEVSKSLASNIQKHFVDNLPNAKKEVKIGDYYMLNEISAPSVIVECGFLSNPEEESLLISENYKNQVCYSMLLGVLEYLR